MCVPMCDTSHSTRVWEGCPWRGAGQSTRPLTSQGSPVGHEDTRVNSDARTMERNPGAQGRLRDPKGALQPAASRELSTEWVLRKHPPHPREHLPPGQPQGKRAGASHSPLGVGFSLCRHGREDLVGSPDAQAPPQQ